MTDITRIQLESSGGDLLSTITISKYILARLKQLGVKYMFGVPGDYYLRFLDVVEDDEDITWVGECNELNAAYAADGYARIKQALGVVATTFGVGELSAINGVAGSFSEELPVLHIVGQPTTVRQREIGIIHHTLGDGRYDAFSQCAKQITYSQAILTNAENAAEKIDQVLLDCITQSRPTYLALPADLINAEIPSDRLSDPLKVIETQNPPQAEEAVIHRIYELFLEANADAVVIVDASVVRHKCVPEVYQFLRETRLPVYSTPMGKSVIDETYDRYGGVYFGDISSSEVKRKVESAKLIMLMGPIKSDFNTGNFTYNIPRDRTIEIQFDRTQIFYATYLGVGMKPLLPKLTERLEVFGEIAAEIGVPKFVNVPLRDAEDRITHAWFWPRLGQWFETGDVVLTETGTSNFGIVDVRLPKDATLLAQMLWSSIGWSVGAAHGAALALQENPRGSEIPRTILFIGDGSLQMTVQEFSGMLRSGVKPIIFVINNSGYTIERYIDNPRRKYNDITNWDWTLLFKVLGDTTSTRACTYTVRTALELEALLEDDEFGKGECIWLVEVVMDKMDAPEALVRYMMKTKREGKFGYEDFA